MRILFYTFDHIFCTIAPVLHQKHVHSVWQSVRVNALQMLEAHLKALIFLENRQCALQFSVC